MCGSPDGVVVEIDENFNLSIKLLEIKCPTSCKDRPIVEIVDDEIFINVPYLDVNPKTGQIVLKKNDKYYTQIQILMYLINSESCYFYIYSPVESELLIVPRDEGFIKKVIFKLEDFYFKYFLPFVSATFKPKNK